MDRLDGWIVFAGVMSIVVGVVRAIYGMVAVLNDQRVAAMAKPSCSTSPTWGWIDLIIGVVVVLAGFGAVGQHLARIIGVAVAVISLVALFLALALPVWLIIVIAIDLLVIWALTADGSETKSV